jgi:hypothetical protein
MNIVSPLNINLVKGFSFIFLIKITFIFILVLIAFYLFYLECALIEAQNKNYKPDLELSRSNKVNKFIQDLILKYIPGALSYYTFVHGLKEKQDKKNQIKDNTDTRISDQKSEEKFKGNDMYVLLKDESKLKDITNEIKNNPLLNEMEKVLAQAKTTNMAEFVQNMIQSQKMRNNYTNRLQEIKDLKVKEAKGNKLTENELLSLKEENTCKTLIETQDFIIKKNLENFTSNLDPDLKNNFINSDIKNILSDEGYSNIKKSSIFISDFNFKEILKRLTDIELLALGNLFFNQLILSYTVSIILILYGDYLIKRFELVKKYPKIAKFIQ